MIRLGLDLHGVIDANPKFFSDLSDMLLNKGHDVYIVTGREDCYELRQEISDCDMIYSGILSITSYQKSQGIPVHYLNGNPAQPLMDPKVWNPTKAMLCATAGIHLMIDDSTLYEPFFQDIKTQYLVYTPEVRELLTLMFQDERE